MNRLGGAAFAELIDDACAQHSDVIPAESYTALDGADERLRAVTVLQQKAQSLEMALAAERTARSAAEAALRARDEFLSIAAHELRTPLTTLSGQAQMALRQLRRDGNLEPERGAQALQAITRQSDTLAQLVSRLLDVSRLDAGKLALERRPTDLALLTEQAVSGAQSRTDRHTITLTAPDSLEAWVDPLRLEQVLTNLLDNAIKYSPGVGTIDVVLTQPEPGVVELSVRDHGLGIPPERRRQIFERYAQAHNASHRSGLGLGLYISRQIVELHGGSIRAEFPADGGTRIVVRLPLAPDDSAASTVTS
jgi:signal transduction histidine kinase